MVNGKNQITNFPKKLLLACPRGFCAGVERAIEALNQVVTTYPNRTVYCYHQIVHNTHVVKNFEEKGVKFVNSLEEVPLESVVVFSSHGVPPYIVQQAKEKKLHFFDATCPFVSKTHFEVKKYASEGYQIIYIGQINHDEAVGTTGEAPDQTMIIQTVKEAEKVTVSNPEKVALVTQTTLSFNETEKIKQVLRNRFPNLLEPLKSDICMATQNRQNGVKELVKKGAKVVIVLGSPNSSNSNKLKKVAESAGAKGYLLDEIYELDPSLLLGVGCVGLTGGASLPEYKITEAVEWFKNHGVLDIEELIVADEKKASLAPIKTDVN